MTKSDEKETTLIWMQSFDTIVHYYEFWNTSKSIEMV